MDLIAELQGARWFGGKSRAVSRAAVVDRASWTEHASMRLVEVQYEHGPSETYVLADRLEDPSVNRALLGQFRGASVPTEAGNSLAFRPTRELIGIPVAATEPIVPLRGEQSNTSIRFGDALILKLFRRLQFGPNPDVEIGWFLSEHTLFRGTPAVVGSLEYVRADGDAASLALLQRFEPNRGDAWTTTLQRLRSVLDGADMTREVEAMARLARTTADLHLALASGEGDFSAQPITAEDVEAWGEAIRQELATATHALARRSIDVDSVALLQRADGILGLQRALKTRHHGDYHLGQVLERDDESFVVIDFEGEPTRPLAQRREKRSPLRDVAGMLRSFDYARHAALRAASGDDVRRVGRADDWYRAVRTAFLEAYLARVRGEMPALLPKEIEPALNALELEKAAYEVVYELNNRPEWLPIPLAALRSASVRYS